MNIDSIKNGIVIDHISAGKAMQIYEMLSFNSLSCPVAMIMNVASGKMGKKDIIKIDGEIDVNLSVIGYVSPDSTVNIIKDGEIIEKSHIAPPKTLTNIIKCKNARCISTSERDIDHVFILTNEEKREYRCLYCESVAK